MKRPQKISVCLSLVSGEQKGKTQIAKNVDNKTFLLLKNPTKSQFALLCCLEAFLKTNK